MYSQLILRSRAKHGVSKDGQGPRHLRPSFETALRASSELVNLSIFAFPHLSQIKGLAGGRRMKVEYIHKLSG